MTSASPLTQAQAPLKPSGLASCHLQRSAHMSSTLCVASQPCTDATPQLKAAPNAMLGCWVQGAGCRVLPFVGVPVLGFGLCVFFLVGTGVGLAAHGFVPVGQPPAALRFQHTSLLVFLHGPDVPS